MPRSPAVAQPTFHIAPFRDRLALRSDNMCFGSRKTDEAGLAKSRELDKQIRQDEKRLAKEVKLLLLGMFAPSCCSCSHQLVQTSVACNGRLRSKHLELLD